ncbi:ATP-grasp domain-containing protein [Methanosarcina sp. MSH10X1]|uniref:ATP-grasp domain-containing protein n=1 Tax=Methanosarcina sp. MSH10X1 TaxID=2507075 RepID=UPI000FFCC20E|nr:ATP-grasp domain-containing protein [Methanosarcina sp. MSH10X1]RXA19961.1 ATP-grasp domain-containing protein [Methanosarcina sp. MSH10X1]
MIILDSPYVSEFLKNTAAELQIPVLKNDMAAGLNPEKGLRLLEDAEFIEFVKEKGESALYSNSENSIGWISENLGFTGLPEKIELFKNKIKFRELLERLYPELYFRGVKFEELDKLRVEEIEKPFIIKPAVGFFSLGVHKVSTDAEWDSVLKHIKAEVGEIKELYPAQVLDMENFIIEGNIEGEEFAVDAYFNSEGKPVVLNILKHIFSSENDVSDRVYFTSKRIIETYREAVEDLLKEIGKLAGLRNFPLHLELRIGKDRRVQPIELNPMRFAGLCTTDIAYFAYGINNYRYFLEQLEPDWETILAGKEGKNFCLIMLNRPENLNLKAVKAFDYKKLLSDFEKPLELREVDHEKFGFFGYMFTETRDTGWKEIENILKSDLREYITFKEIAQAVPVLKDECKAVKGL